MAFYVFGQGVPAADWCEDDEDAIESVCDEACDHFIPGGPACTCYGSTETTEGGW